MPKAHTHTSFFLLLVLILMNTPAISGGFQINMLGMKATSMAGVQTGFGRDASSVFHNPGAMTFQEFSQISAGMVFSSPSTSYLSPYSGNYDAANQLYTPFHVYGLGILNEKSAVGISINTPYHIRSKWDSDWPGKYIVTQANSKAVYYQPTYSYKLSETFGAGIGAIVAYGRTQMTKSLPTASQQGDIEMELDGKSLGFGFNVGMFWQPSDEFSAGLNYRSAVKMNVNKGEASFSNVPLSETSAYPDGAGFETSYTLPSMATIGATVRVTRELHVCADISYTFWSVYDTLSFEFSNTPSLDFGIGRFYDNSFAFRVGAQYKASDRIDLRAGAAFDQTPVPYDHLSPDDPDNDRFMFSLGGTVRFGEKVSVDLAYMLQNIKEHETANVETGFSGSFKSLNNIFGFTLNYHFAQ
jgi:long-chain fatty acid transport protein